ncbi:MAG: hypothetical protein MHPSP_003523, partial [Paramarteilia canceri]
DDLAIILNTSGTTGEPKLVMLTHKNLVSGAKAASERAETLNEILDFKNRQIKYYAMLPEHHLLGQLNKMMIKILGGKIVYPSGVVKEVFANDLKLVKPNVLVLVPLLLEQVKQKIESSIKKNLLLSCIFKTARYFDKKLQIRWPFSLFYKKIESIFGGNVKLIIVGGAPLLNETGSFVKTFFGVKLIQGYGLSECFVSVQSISDNTNNVGKPLKSVEIKLIDALDNKYQAKNNEGELCVRGDGLFIGYFGEENTKEYYTEDGYYKTGDIGRLGE